MLVSMIKDVIVKNAGKKGKGVFASGTSDICAKRGEIKMAFPAKYACEKCGKQMPISVAPHLRPRLDLCKCS